MCMGSHGFGIPLDSPGNGNGNKISHGNGNGIGMGTKCIGMGIKTWEWGKYSHRNTALNLKVSKDTNLIQFWLDNKSVLPKLYTVTHSIYVCQHLQLPVKECSVLLVAC